MSKIIFGLVGPLASGKEVSRRYLENKYGADTTRFSSSLRDILNRLYLPVNRQNMQNLSLDLRQRFGGDVLSRVIAEDASASQKEIMAIDGVRRLDDIKQLKDLPGFNLVSIDAAPEIRYQRMKARNENQGDAEKTYEDFLADNQREAELEIPHVMSQAKYHLDNNGSLDDLYRQLDKLVEELRQTL